MPHHQTCRPDERILQALLRLTRAAELSSSEDPSTAEPPLDSQPALDSEPSADAIDADCCDIPVRSRPPRS